MRYIICRPDFYNLKTRKKLSTYAIVRFELSMNKNTKRPQAETMLSHMDIAEYIFISYNLLRNK